MPSISSALLTEINEAFPELVVVANGEPQYLIRFLDYDNSVLYRQVVAEGGDAVNPVTAGYITAPTRTGTEDSGYAFKDFGTLPTNVHSNGAVYAVYDTTYRVQFMNDSTVYDTQWIVSGESATTPTPDPTKASTAQYTYTFSNWDKSYTNITEPLTVNAVYTSTVRRYTVKFYNGSTLLQTVTDVPYGGSASFSGTTPVKDGVDDPENYVFNGWSPSPNGITGTTSCYAQYNYTGLVETITDDWATILANIANGTYATKYAVGDTKSLDLGTEGVVNMQIAAMDADEKADGSGNAPITWVSEQLLATSHRINLLLASTTDEETGDEVYTEGTGAIGGWEKSEMRTYLTETIKPLIPEEVRNAIVPVKKTQPAFDTAKISFTQTTTDTVWIPSFSEISGESSLYYGLFQNTSANRIKMKAGATSASNWWLRSAHYAGDTFNSVNSSGSTGYVFPTNKYGVALGFCT